MEEAYTNIHVCVRIYTVHIRISVCPSPTHGRAEPRAIRTHVYRYIGIRIGSLTRGRYDEEGSNNSVVGDDVDKQTCRRPRGHGKHDSGRRRRRRRRRETRNPRLPSGQVFDCPVYSLRSYHDENRSAGTPRQLSGGRQRRRRGLDFPS